MDLIMCEYPNCGRSLPVTDDRGEPNFFSHTINGNGKNGKEIIICGYCKDRLLRLSQREWPKKRPVGFGFFN